MKQAVFLDNLIGENFGNVPSKVDGDSQLKPSDIGLPLERCVDRGDSGEGLPLLEFNVERLPWKNTFIHFNTARFPGIEPQSPTPSAPDVLLTHAFLTRSEEDVLSRWFTDEGSEVMVPPCRSAESLDPEGRAALSDSAFFESWYSGELPSSLSEFSSDSEEIPQAQEISIPAYERMLADFSLSSEIVPEKNTFIHYDLCTLPYADMEPPTKTAPGVMLSRLFATKMRGGCLSELPQSLSEYSSDSDQTLQSPEDLSSASERTLSCLSMSFGVMPQNNTFIHCDIRTLSQADSEVLMKTAPGVVRNGFLGVKTFGGCLSEAGLTTTTAPPHSLATDSPAIFNSKGSQTDDSGEDRANSPIDASQVMHELHALAQCTPCHYFWYKTDGCRQGADCTFCHLCPKGEIKKRKKDKLKMLRRAGLLRK
jgi:hypothetical protein